MLVLAFLVALTWIIAPPTETADTCSMARGRTPFVRWEDETRVLATILPERPQDKHCEPLGHMCREKPLGHLVFLETVEGEAAETVAARSNAVVFRWYRDASCAVRPRSDSVRAGTQHHFTLALRPDSLWVDSLPTFDVPPDHPLGEFPGSVTYAKPPALLPEYLDFVSILPREANWKEDCRPGTQAVVAWKDSHREAAPYQPINVSDMRLREDCSWALMRKSESLERWDMYQREFEISEVLRESGLVEECRFRTGPREGKLPVVGGQFVPASVGGTGQQWAMICVSPNHWQLLIVISKREVRVIELAKLVGKARNWFLTVAPPEYFHWTSALEFNYAERWRSPRPKLDVVILAFSKPKGNQKLAFYWTEEGWRQVTVNCCRWPDNDG